MYKAMQGTVRGAWECSCPTEAPITRSIQRPMAVGACCARCAGAQAAPLSGYPVQGVSHLMYVGQDDEDPRESLFRKAGTAIAVAWAVAYLTGNKRAKKATFVAGSVLLGLQLAHKATR